MEAITAELLTTPASGAPEETFREEPAGWRSTAEEAAARTGAGDVDNRVTGGRRDTVVMGRDFDGPITFHRP
ncbi:hypothetical protein ABZ135_22815 [Streptomyces sp. NPDC006339]|uniref:hypothetical protein n=1 Tax=Streptomyces sp. NPDC006339 TaxID=3156755 RepID=UPI0033B44ED4